MFKIKVVDKNGVPRDSKNPRINQYDSDDLEKTLTFVAGLNVADVVFWRDRYRILQFLDDNHFVII